MKRNLKEMTLGKLIVCIFMFFFILNGIYYILIDLNIQFLRAESGLYLKATAASPEETSAFFKKHIYSSINGHWTPLVFLAEYWQAVVFSTNETYWFWRQIFIAAAFLTSITIYCLSLSMPGEEKTGPTMRMILTALSIGVIFGFQPIITTLIAWPFMAFQLMCLTLSAISFFFLVQYAQTANRVRLWQALVFGYLTMHTLGTGLAVSISVLFTATLLIAFRWYSDPDRKLSLLIKSLVPVFFVTVLTVGHTILMAIGVAHSSESEKVSLLTSGIRFGGLLIEMLHSSLIYLWAPGGLAWPAMRGLEADSVYGWGLVLLVITAVFSLCFRYLKAPSDQLLVRIVLLTAPSLTLCLIVAMITYRAQTVAGNDVLINYIIGDRYLIFSSFFGFLFCVGLFLNSKTVFTKTAVACFAVAASVSLAGNTTFMLTTAREIWPTKSISHTEFWNDLRKVQQSDPDFQSAYWNQSTQSITELDGTRLSFKSLIEQQLHDAK